MSTVFFLIQLNSECFTLTYKLGQNICRLFHVLVQFPFNISEMELVYYSQKVIVRVPHELRNDLRNKGTRN